MTQHNSTYIKYLKIFPVQTFDDCIHEIKYRRNKQSGTLIKKDICHRAEYFDANIEYGEIYGFKFLITDTKTFDKYIFDFIEKYHVEEQKSVFCNGIVDFVEYAIIIKTSDKQIITLLADRVPTRKIAEELYDYLSNYPEMTLKEKKEFYDKTN